MSSVRDVLIKAASEYEAPLVKVCVCVLGCFRFTGMCLRGECVG